MYKNLLSVFSFLLILLSLNARAQTDTSKYDVGRVQLSKNFTQAITIKATDLEKMPFTNLSEAIDAWVYGINGRIGYVFMIDGNMAGNVNAYSIYDIDEISIVQNVLVQVSGVSPTQLLVLVKTKKGRAGKKGVEMAGQTNAINLRDPSVNSHSKSTTEIYNQYYISGYTSSSTTQAGISADVQHNAIPLLITSLGRPTATPYGLNRFKFNAYLDHKLSNNHTLSVNVGYAPQTKHTNTAYQLLSASTVTTQSIVDRTSDNLLHADVKLNSKLTPSLTNILSAGLQHYHTEDNASNTQSQVFPVSTSSLSSSTNSSAVANSYLIKDNLAYKVQAGEWIIEPNLNLSVQSYKSNTSAAAKLVSNPGGFDTMIVSNTDGVLKRALLTPAVAFTYGDVLLVQAGMQYVINNKITNTYFYANGHTAPNISPFANLTMNLLQLDKAYHGNTRLMIYASYAKSSTAIADPSVDLIDQSSSGYTADIGDTHYNPYQPFNQIQLGAGLLKGSKFSFTYNYSIRQFLQSYPVYYPAYGYYVTFDSHPAARYDIHRLAFNVDVVQARNFSWRSSLNIALIKTSLASTAQLAGSVVASPVYFIPNSNITAGGFVNRFTYKNAFAGADMVYRLNQDIYSGSAIPTGHYNSFVLQNLYAGLKFTLKGNKTLQVFANARNLFQNLKSDITDNRRYYGLGFRFGL